MCVCVGGRGGGGLPISIIGGWVGVETFLLLHGVSCLICVCVCREGRG